MICRANLLSFFVLLLLSGSAFAAADREASFMPVDSEDANAEEVTETPAVPPATAVTTTPSPTPASAPVTTAVVPTPTPPVTVAAPTTTEAVPTVPPPTPMPDVIAKPVKTQSLPEVDPQTVGLLTESSGGLGAGLWDGTPRALVERLLPELNLPTASPTLNDLARRLLLSTAALPQGESKTPGAIITARLTKLLALGETTGAWKLSQRTPPELVDDITLRLVIETSLLGPSAKEVCDKMPSILAAHKTAEWQKAQIVCQLWANDNAGAQLGFDMLREQPASDQVFMSLLERNIFATSKQLPRQLTPLRPLNLALLRITNLPMPPELYAHPDAALVDTLLQAKTTNEAARLTLAEKMAGKGMISTARLAAVYKEVLFTPEIIADAVNSSETGARARALVYQALSQESLTSVQRTDLIGKFLQVTDASMLTGTVGQLLADVAATVPPTTDYNRFAGIATRLFALTGRTEQTLAWYKLVQGPAGHLPDVTSVMKDTWPLLVLMGLVSDTDYSHGLQSWLDDTMKSQPDNAEAAKDDADKATAKDANADPHALRRQTGSILVLLSAAGYAVPDDIWIRVLDVMAEGKRMMPPSPVMLEQLRDAGTSNRRGEAVLSSLILAGGEASEVPLFISVDAIRALREVGLTVEARSLAREVAARLLITNP